MIQLYMRQAERQRCQNIQFNEVKTSNTYDLRFLQVDVTNKSKKVFIHERIKQHTLSFCQNKFYYFLFQSKKSHL